MTICRMRVPCWIPKATNTNPQYVLHIAFCTTKMVSCYSYIVWFVKRLLKDFVQQRCYILVMCDIGLTFVFTTGFSEWNNSAPIGTISTKFRIRVFLENLLKKFKLR